MQPNTGLDIPLKRFTYPCTTWDWIDSTRASGVRIRILPVLLGVSGSWRMRGLMGRLKGGHLVSEQVTRVRIVGYVRSPTTSASNGRRCS